jgi:hypothetical protein
VFGKEEEYRLFSVLSYGENVFLLEELIEMEVRNEKIKANFMDLYQFNDHILPTWLGTS